jgi:hypothetical protein
MEHAGSRAIEVVSVYYPEAQHEPFDRFASTAAWVGPEHGQSKYIRVWTYNSWGFPAHRVEVYVDRILHEGEVIEAERCPMHWADFKDAFEYPKAMRQGHANGWYVDICAADSIDPRLQFLSLKGIERGYHKYSSDGIYTVELSAEASKPCSFDRLTLTIAYDEKDWTNLQVISAK